MAVAVEIEQSLAAKFSALLPHLDERTQRLYLGSEARSLGHCGIAAVARAAGVSRQTVTSGVDQLESGSAPLERVQRPGEGRKRAVEVDPGLRSELLALVEPDTRGDLMSPLRWTTKSTRTLAAELARQGHRVSADTVGDLLRGIATTTTRTGLTLHAELDTDTYATGIRVSDGQVDTLPLDRYDWHGDWNYTLRPEAYPQAPIATPDPFDQPSPDLAWLCQPAVTGLPLHERGRPDHRPDHRADRRARDTTGSPPGQTTRPSTPIDDRRHRPSSCP